MKSVLGSSRWPLLAALSDLSSNSRAKGCGTYPSARIPRGTRWLSRRIWCGRRYLGAVSVLLFMLGAAAFVFSAVSPDDDDIQQEFAQQRFHYSLITRIAKTRPSHLPCNRKIASAALLAPSVSLHQEWEELVVVELSTSAVALAPIRGQRSPPLFS